MRGREIEWLQHKAVGGARVLAQRSQSTNTGRALRVDTVRGFLIPLSAGGLEFLVVQFQCPVPVALHGPVYPLQGL